MAKNKSPKDSSKDASKSADLKHTQSKNTTFMDDVVKKHEQLKSTGSGGNFFKVQSGENELRLITFVDGTTQKEHLFSPYKQHFINRVKKSYVCLGNVKSCPICRYISSIELKEGQTEFSKNARSKEKFYLNALDIAGAMVVLDIGSQAMQAITAIFANRKYGNIADLKNGRNITLTKTGSGLDTVYTALPDPNVNAVKKLPEKPKDLNALVIAKQPNEQDLIEFVESTFDVVYANLFEGIDTGDLPF